MLFHNHKIDSANLSMHILEIQELQHKLKRELKKEKF